MSFLLSKVEWFDFQAASGAAFLSSLGGFKLTAVLLAALTSLSLVLSYILSWTLYEWKRRYGKAGGLPPRYPSLIPWIGGAIAILFNGQYFLDQAT